MILRSGRRRGFTIVEVLVVVSVIAVLVAFLIPALANVRKTGQQTDSISRMKQIGQWMRLYSTDNREYILPSRFDYSGDQYTYKGKVRAPVDVNGSAVSPTLGVRHAGTWADILWTLHGPGGFDPTLANPALPYDYANDSPDHFLYMQVETFENILRSAAANSRNTGQVAPGSQATPYGPGAYEAGEPGYFAANDFFDATPEQGDPADLGRWWITGQIRVPDKSMYLVDSVAGETIGEAGANATAPGLWEFVMDTVRNNGQSPPWGNDSENGGEEYWTCHVDFRYNGNCLMLFLDGHVEPLAPWGAFANLRDAQKVRTYGLDR